MRNAATLNGHVLSKYQVTERVGESEYNSHLGRKIAIGGGLLVAAAAAVIGYKALTNDSPKNTAEEVQKALINPKAQGEVMQNPNYERFQGRITPYSKEDFPNIDEKTYYIYCEKIIELVDKGDTRQTPYPARFPQGEILVNRIREVNPKYIFIQPGLNPDKYYEVGIQFREEGGRANYFSIVEYKGDIQVFPFGAPDRRRNKK